MINKKIGILIIVLAFLAAFGSSHFYFASREGSKITMSVEKTDYKAPVTNGDAEVDSNEPKTEPCPMNGQLFSKSAKDKWEKRRPMGIMVENHTEARPQSGLSSADVIYEAVAEGGITRFLTIFYCQDAKYVGPVRSARIYFLKLLQGYGDHPLYAHVGGANTDGPADALGEIEKLKWAGYNDLNQFSVPFPIFYRDYDRLPDRATEHTVYTSTAKLWEYAQTKRKLTNVDEDGKSWDKNFKPWQFKDDAKTADIGTVAKINYGFWDQFANDFSVTWTYDKTTNSYKRDNGGAPHIDKNTNKQLEAKDVVVAFAKESVANDGYENGQHLLYGIIGKGNAIIFQDGKSIKGTWTKSDEEEMMRFYDDTGKEVKFTRGKIWISILPTGNKVEY